MAFFGMDAEKKALNHGPVDTIIGNKAKIKGEISSSGGVSISGEFEGKIQVSGELILSPGSKISGEIRGGHVIVSGKVEGNIVADHVLEITKSGKVSGDLVGGKIVIEDGASYSGRVRVVGKEEEIEIVEVESTTGEPQPFLAYKATDPMLEI